MRSAADGQMMSQTPAAAAGAMLVDDSDTVTEHARVITDAQSSSSPFLFLRCNSRDNSSTHTSGGIKRAGWTSPPFSSPPSLPCLPPLEVGPLNPVKGSGIAPVSYTHLTLPTNREV